ncbi:hypothetical protein UL79_14710 [Shigella dysenteriae]|nr:hypothetical protein C5K22_14425 [Shigella dysenteriae]PQN59758.1 hypothetical protein C5K17_00610 [Shigella dysenteriae]RIG15447.1 hypothetical protein UL56_14940 [Shigella dysenteriae]RIH34651.1 hypothetical protein UL63_13550 [Shigella dysenteriae]RIH39115.1 hypothetical protein UL79_14710 [Shigella dysenteriae]
MAFEYFTVCIIQLFRTEQNQAYYNWKHHPNIILSPEFMIHGSKLSITIIAKNKPDEIIP